MRERTALDDILEPGAIQVRFQPIYEISGNGAASVYALESLARGPAGTNMEQANVLFEYVRRKRQESLVDRVCITTALIEAKALVQPTRIGLNVHASTLGRDHGFVDFLRYTAIACGVALPGIMIEIVEHAPPWDGRSFLSAIEALRKLGVEIALDDVGLGQSNFKMILDVRPDYLKIDRYFVHGCSIDKNRQAVLESLQQLALRFGSRVIAEGIEQDQDLRAVQSLGIDLVQGFLLSRASSIEDINALAAGAARQQLSVQA